MKPLSSRIWLLMLGILVAMAIGAAALMFSIADEKPEAGTPLRNPSGLNTTPHTLLKKIVDIAKPELLSRH